jgi:hypothetical protein
LKDVFTAVCCKEDAEETFLTTTSSFATTLIHHYRRRASADGVEKGFAVESRRYRPVMLMV